ncbi:MAG: SdrD B-like domain-containing protein, partial [Actinomycetota bacterium]
MLLTAALSTGADGTITQTLVPNGNFLVVETDKTSPKYLSTNANVVAVTFPATGGATTNTVTFLDTRAYTISGTVFADLNGDGARAAIAANEPGVAGFTVYLDANNDEVLNRDGGGVPTEPSTTTAADGSYSFVDRVYGSYAVRYVDRSGFEATPVAAPVLQRDVTVPTGTLTGNDFPVRRTDLRISGSVYADLDGSATSTPGDQPIGGSTVRLYADSATLPGTWDGTNAPLTDALPVGGDGAWTFGGTAGLKPGTYFVVQTLPSGYLATNAVAGSGGGVKETETRFKVVLTTADAIDNVFLVAAQDATVNGLVRKDLDGTPDAVNDPVLEPVPAPASTTIRAYRDANGNGSYDAASDLLVGTTTSGAGGAYSFSLTVGTYFLVLTPPTVGGNAWANTTPSPQVKTVTVAALGTATAGPFFVQPRSSISGFVYSDLNADGANTTNTGIASAITITLTRSDGAGGWTSPVTTTTCTANNCGGVGSWTFAGLAPGTYRVVETDLSATTWASTNATGATKVDNNTLEVTLTDATVSGRQVLDAPEQASISCTLYIDTNGNGAIDTATDSTRVGVLVYLDLNLTGSRDTGEPT